MSSELRLKKLRGSGGYVMANVNDDQQMKGNLGGPDLFLAPIGRLKEEKISRYYCNTCEKEFESSPDIQYENPNEEVAENLILAEKGQYKCSTCNGTIAEYREFKKQDESVEIGNAKPEAESGSQSQTDVATSQTVQDAPEASAQQQAERQQNTEGVTQLGTATSVNKIEGMDVFDENANMVGKAKQVGVDSNQSVVLIIIKNDGTEASVPWSGIKKIGQIILLGSQEQPQDQLEKCSSCGFANKEGSKFCEECGNKLPI